MGVPMLAERDQLLSEVYDELRAAASRMLHRDAPMLTLQPTELVNEAALRIIRLEQMSWNDRQHFFVGDEAAAVRELVGVDRRGQFLRGGRKFVVAVAELPSLTRGGPERFLTVTTIDKHLRRRLEHLRHA